MTHLLIYPPVFTNKVFRTKRNDHKSVQKKGTTKVSQIFTWMTNAKNRVYKQTMS